MNNLHVIGIDHRTTKLELREQLMFVPNLLSKAYKSIQTCKLDEVVLLSTCARTECIVITDNPEAIKTWFARFHNVAQAELDKHLVHYSNADAIIHLMRIASGVDSFILGETQILGQLKKAFINAQANELTSSIFYKLFPAIFCTAKQVRTKTNIGCNTISLPAAIAKLSNQIFPELSNCNVMLIGVGEMINLAGTHLHKQGVNSWYIANRTLANVQSLAHQFAGKDIVIEEMAKYLPEVDIIISATASPVPLIGKGLIERVQKQRSYRSLAIFDLAMPRDIEPEVDQVNGVKLYHLDDLQKIIQTNLQERSLSIAKAETIINSACQNFLQEQRTLEQIQAVRNFRDHVLELRSEAQEYGLNKLNSGHDPATVIIQTLNKFSQKMMHIPTINLRKAARDHNYQVIKSASFIFNSNKDEINAG